MKVFSGISLILGTAAFAAAAPTPEVPGHLEPGVSCIETKGKIHEKVKISLSRRYILETENIPKDTDIAEVCGNLWKGLQRFGPQCAAWSYKTYPHYCGESLVTKGELEWKFETSILCNSGMVESAWFNATQNDFGIAKCEAQSDEASDEASDEPSTETTDETTSETSDAISDETPTETTGETSDEISAEPSDE